MTHTTEELIVQYLDGELVRKELETMLFERLAESPEARGILREYLTMRGAIHVSLDDARFQLSSDLDARTRLRIEQMLETIAIDEPAVAHASYAADALPVATQPVTRRLNRWSLRPSIAALALLLAVGATWFLTRETTPRIAATVPASSATDRSSTQNSQVVIATLPAQDKEQAANTGDRIVPVVSKRVAATRASDMAQNAQAPATQPAAVQQQPSTPQEDPGDVMLSRRTAKFLNAASTEKREVVVSSRDRL
jgi:hypothetical protein